ncbi:hypothetical protein LARV_03356 [Longilinea arvoryzae]|uniref:Uncharacterized protein n=1 Tax=Longilinea arvoryzae TaxID=360412 RepID=A0A0S7BIH7_9CHLR|nr:hypothetical protein [Longilinea arvoryzae]GAP15565.1 hypothetical protein LARV_03356 [Longilinea arvoryzae]
MKQKRWLAFLWFAADLAILAASALFKWQRWVELPQGSYLPTLMREHWAGTPVLVTNLAGMLSFFLTSLVIYFLLPRTLRSIGGAPARRGGVIRAALLGLFTGLLVFFIVLSSAVGSGTFPFAMVVLALVLLASVVGMVALELRIGAWLAALAGWPESSPAIHLLMAVLVLYPFTILPAIGGLFMVIYVLFGLGTVVLARVNVLYPWNHELPHSNEKQLEKELTE